MTAPIPERHPDRSTRTEEPMSLTDDALEQVGRLFKENAELRTELAAVRAELADHLATDCADAAAGQNAERAEQAEARAQYLDEEALRLQRTIDEARKQRDDWQQAFGTAYARAEKAEAALVELLARLGEMHDEWVVRFADGYGGKQERKRPNELYARKTLDWARAFDPAAKAMRRVAGEWRDVDAAPRTVLERAADEQGDGGN